MAVPEWQYDFYERLRQEILKVAVDDYKTAIRKSKRLGEKCTQEQALENFFLGEWGQLLSGDHGEYIVERCRKEHRYVPSTRGRQKLTKQKQRADSGVFKWRFMCRLGKKVRGWDGSGIQKHCEVGLMSDKYCKGCIYYKSINDFYWYCGYIFDVGHKRPCDPGKGCTVKVKQKINKTKEKGIGNGKDI